MPDADFLIIGKVDLAGLRRLEALLHERQIAHILFEHRCQRAQLRRIGPWLVGTEHVQRHTARDRLARRYPGQHAHFHQAVVDILRRAEAIDDIGHEPPPGREIGEDIIDQRIEQFGVGGVAVIMAEQR